MPTDRVTLDVTQTIVLDEEEWAAFSAEIAAPQQPSAALRAMSKRGDPDRTRRCLMDYERDLLGPR
jgi:uncharacterized protein (DUF1778 family)